MKVIGMKLSNRKKIILTGISILLICCFIPVYLFFIKTETIRITWMPVVDAQDVINQYIQVGYCSSGYISADKSYAEVEVTEWQRRKWLNYLYDDIGGYIERANQINYMNIKVSSDTKSLTVSADREVSFETLATYLGIISWDIEMIQILNGEADWGFEFTVKDMETEQVLYNVYFPEEKVKVYESFWDELEE